MGQAIVEGINSFRMIFQLRKAMLLLAVLGLAGSLWAAEPIIGTWKLNIAKSKFSPAMLGGRAPLKEATMVIRKAGDLIEITYEGTRTDGSPILQKSTVPREGGILMYEKGGLGEGIVVIFTRFDAYNSCFTRLQNGEQVYVNVTFISKDGKTQQDHYRGTDAQGNPFEQIVVYEKQ
jgi:hypothetical protein